MAMSPGAKEIFELSRAKAAADTTAPNPSPTTVPNQESAPVSTSGSVTSSPTTSTLGPGTAGGAAVGAGMPRRAPEIGLRTADRLAARLPPALAGFVRGAAERVVEPVQDIANAARQGQPLAAVGPALQLAQFTNPFGAAVAAGGTALQGIAEAAGVSQNSARYLAAGVETAASLLSFGKAKMDLRAGRTMLGEASEMGGASGGLLKKERVMESVRGEARTNLIARQKHWQGVLDKTEVEIGSSGSIQPNTPTWHKLQETVNDFGEIMGTNVSKDTPASRVAAGLQSGNVDPFDVVQLRRELSRKENYSADLKSPDAAMNAKMIRTARTKLADVLEGAAPNTRVAADYAAARSRYAAEYAKPWRALEDVLNPNTSPVQAFGQVFNTGDLHTFRAVQGAVKANPAMAGKLRMGLIEGLGEASNGFHDAGAALDRLRNIRPALQTTGLFTPAELNSLEGVLRQKRIPTLMDGLRYAVSTPGRAGVTAGATGGSLALAHFMAVNPAAALGSVVAAGALPHLIRASIVPAGSPAMRNASMVIGSKVAQLARTLRHGEGPASPVEAGDSDE